MKEYSCDYRVYTRKIYIIRGKLKNFKVQLLRSNALFLCRHEDTKIYIYRKSASRFSRGTVLNTLKQSRINIMRGKKDATTFPDKPVS